MACKAADGTVDGTGKVIGNAQADWVGKSGPREGRVGIWWDADPLRELLNGVTVTKWDWENSREAPLFDARHHGCRSINDSKSNPCLCADIFGEWREEIVAASRDGKGLRIFTTPIPATVRRVTLMHDPVYRLGIAWQNTGYNQPAHTSYFIERRASSRR